MNSSRGSFPLPAGLYATARSSDRSGADLRFVSGDASAVVDSGWGICFHWGFGRWQSAAARRLFDIVIGRKGNADGGVLACQPSLKRLANETLTVLRFHKPIGVLRAIRKDCVVSCLLGTRQNAATPWKDSIQGFVRIRILNLRV